MSEDETSSPRSQWCSLCSNETMLVCSFAAPRVAHKLLAKIMLCIIVIRYNLITPQRTLLQFYNPMCCLILPSFTTFSFSFSLLLYAQNGCTALYLASGKGHVAVVKLLLQRLADVSISREVLIVTQGQSIFV